MKKLIITNKGAQEVKAPLPQKATKTGKVKAGNDLRTGSTKKN